MHDLRSLCAIGYQATDFCFRRWGQFISIFLIALLFSAVSLFTILGDIKDVPIDIYAHPFKVLLIAIANHLIVNLLILYLVIGGVKNIWYEIFKINSFYKDKWIDIILVISLKALLIIVTNIIGVLVMVFFAFAEVLVINKNLSFKDAMIRSYELSLGFRWQYILFVFLFFFVPIIVFNQISFLVMSIYIVHSVFLYRQIEF